MLVDNGCLGKYELESVRSETMSMKVSEYRSGEWIFLILVLILEDDLMLEGSLLFVTSCWVLTTSWVVNALLIDGVLMSSWVVSWSGLILEGVLTLIWVDFLHGSWYVVMLEFRSNLIEEITDLMGFALLRRGV